MSNTKGVPKDFFSNKALNDEIFNIVQELSANVASITSKNSKELDEATKKTSIIQVSSLSNNITAITNLMKNYYEYRDVSYVYVDGLSYFTVNGKNPLRLRYKNENGNYVALPEFLTSIASTNAVVRRKESSYVCEVRVKCKVKDKCNETSRLIVGASKAVNDKIAKLCKSLGIDNQHDKEIVQRVLKKLFN